MLHWNSCPTRNMAFSENMLLNLMVHLLVGVFAHRYYLTVTISKGIGPSNECRNQHRSTPQETLRCQPASCHTSPRRLLVARARGLGPTPGPIMRFTWSNCGKSWKVNESDVKCWFILFFQAELWRWFLILTGMATSLHSKSTFLSLPSVLSTVPSQCGLGCWYRHQQSPAHCSNVQFLPELTAAAP